MPSIVNVTVTRQNAAGVPGLVWTTHQQANVGNNHDVYVNAGASNPPPVGFFNNPDFIFIIAGRDLASGSSYTSPPVKIQTSSDPANGAYVFQ